MRPGRPLLVLVSGAPGSGASTLSRRLAAELRLPFLTRDDLAEVLAGAIGLRTSLADAERLERGAFGVFYRVSAEQVRSGNGVVMEQAFQRGVAEEHRSRFLLSPSVG